MLELGFTGATALELRLSEGGSTVGGITSVTTPLPTLSTTPLVLSSMLEMVSLPMGTIVDAAVTGMGLLVVTFQSLRAGGRAFVL